MKLNKATEKGFTLVEVSIILFVLVILSTILLPNIGDYIRLARYSRVKEDLNALCSTLGSYLVDTGESAFYRHGGRDGGGYYSDTPDRTRAIGLLIGDGDTPTLNGRAPGYAGENWQEPEGEYFSEYKDVTGSQVRFRVDTFANHLIQNTPSGSRSNGYRVPADMLDGGRSAGIDGGLVFDPSTGQAFNSRFAWRGPYIADRVDPDP